MSGAVSQVGSQKVILQPLEDKEKPIEEKKANCIVRLIEKVWFYVKWFLHRVTCCHAFPSLSQKVVSNSSSNLSIESQKIPPLSLPEAISVLKESEEIDRAVLQEILNRFGPQLGYELVGVVETEDGDYKSYSVLQLIGYLVDPSFAGKDRAPEAALVLVQKLFEIRAVELGEGRSTASEATNVLTGIAWKPSHKRALFAFLFERLKEVLDREQPYSSEQLFNSLRGIMVEKTGRSEWREECEAAKEMMRVLFGAGYLPGEKIVRTAINEAFFDLGSEETSAPHYAAFLFFREELSEREASCWSEVYRTSEMVSHFIQILEGKSVSNLNLAREIGQFLIRSEPLSKVDAENALDELIQVSLEAYNREVRLLGQDVLKAFLKAQRQNIEQSAIEAYSEEVLRRVQDSLGGNFLPPEEMFIDLIDLSYILLSWGGISLPEDLVQELIKRAENLKDLAYLKDSVKIALLELKGYMQAKVHSGALV